MTSASHIGGAPRLLVVAVFAAITAFAGLWVLPPLDRDEARFAQATVQMIESGDYVTIRFQDRERNKKPAGIYWLQAASVKLFSDVERREIWAFRIPSAIGIVAAAIFTFLIGRRLFDDRTALLAAFLLVSSPLVQAEGLIAKTDGVLLALICLAQLAFIDIYKRFVEAVPTRAVLPIMFWIAQAAAILIKGPIGPLVSVLTGAGLLLAKRDIGWVGRMRPLLGLLLTAALVAPWVVAIQIATDGRFITEAVGGDMVGKIGEAQEHHSGPPGYHLLLVWVLFWPAAGLIIAGVMNAWRQRRAWAYRFLLAWLIPAWIVFEIAATKLPHYVLPLYPALAIMAARAATSEVQTPSLIRAASAIIYGGVSLVAAGLVAIAPVFLSETKLTAPCFLAAILIGVSGLIIAWLVWRGRTYTGGMAASVLAAIFAWTMMSGVLPNLTKLRVSPEISAALEAADRHPLKDHVAPVALAGYNEPSAVFLLGTETALTTGGDAARRLANGTASAAIVETRMTEAFGMAIEHLGAEVETLAVIDGLNYSNGDWVTLTIYALAEPEQQRAIWDRQHAQ